MSPACGRNSLASRYSCLPPLRHSPKTPSAPISGQDPARKETLKRSQSRFQSASRTRRSIGIDCSAMKEEALAMGEMARQIVLASFPGLSVWVVPGDQTPLALDYGNHITLHTRVRTVIAVFEDVGEPQVK